MPTNLYGPGDNFDLFSSHVLPALVRKFHEAKAAGDDEVVIWGSGTPRREFLHVDDLARASVLLMEVYDDPEIINVGTGEDLTITNLAETISSVVGFQGALRYDASKPDGMPRKLLDISKIRALGWAPTVTLRRWNRADLSLVPGSSRKSQSLGKPDCMRRCWQIFGGSLREPGA